MEDRETFDAHMGEYLSDLNELDEQVGSALESFEDSVLESIFVLWDSKSDSWFFDGPVLLRTSKGDICVQLLSGLKMRFSFERVDTDLPVSMGCGEEIDNLFDLSWQPYDVLKDLFDHKILQFYWRADSFNHPLALGCLFDNRISLRIGDAGDLTIPEIVDSKVTNEINEFDDIIQPMSFTAIEAVDDPKARSEMFYATSKELEPLLRTYRDDEEYVNDILWVLDDNQLRGELHAFIRMAWILGDDIAAEDLPLLARLMYQRKHDKDYPSIIASLSSPITKDFLGE